MTRSLVLVILFASTFPLLAQTPTRIGAGVAIGQQYYENYSKRRTLIGGDVLMSRGPLGAQLAFDHVALEKEGGTILLHANALYRWTFVDRWSILAGAGPTYASSDETSKVTWNAAVEFGYRTGNTEVFARVRQYEYALSGFRTRNSPKGPAFSLGLRFNVHR